MATPQPGKSTKWGSFLQQAVAGVESRLDNILANEEEEARLKAKKDSSEQGEASPRSSVNASRAGPSRSSSTRKTNERLQERLARAVARKGSPASVSSKDEKKRTSGSFSTAEGRPSLDSSQGRPSLDVISVASETAPSAEDAELPIRQSTDTTRTKDESDVKRADEAKQGNEKVAPVETDTETVQNGAHASTAEANTEGAQTPSNSTRAEESRGASQELERDTQQDMHDYLEKIDALQSKLKYLANQAAESARNAAASAEPGSLERKLHEKDQQIANLMEEGHRLSKIEMENRAAIKKLRQFIAEKNKAHMQLQKKTDKFEDELEARTVELKAAREAEKQASERVASVAKKEKELASVLAEQDMLRTTVASLNEQLAEANARADQAEQTAQTESLEAAKRQAQEAQDDLTQLRIEKELSESKLRREIQELKDKLDGEKERARILELELRGEQSALESKLETLRSRAEEASSSASGDAQAKLLRQIETLQSQYSVASENWQRIEGSLVARVTNVEKERDEMEKSEAELRKKLREANLKLKKTETELGSTRETVQELQQDLDGVKQKLERSSQRMIEAEQELSATKEDLVKQKRLDEEMLKQRLEEEKAKWQETLATAADLAPPSDGDITHSRKSSLMNSDRALSSSRPRSSLMLNNYTFGTAEPSLERGTPMRQSSFNSTPSQPHPLVRKPSNDVSIIASPAEGAPSIHPLEADEYPPSRSRTGSLQGNADQAPTPASYNATHAQGVNDLISASTVGAGPSVQLVERMSATVRRLESERSASRDELARLTIQRDEARQEVVMLMREVEEKRKCDERIRELETTLEDLDKRYNTTLELLGEKSEMVEELHADVAELKRIYRELVDSTMK